MPFNPYILAMMAFAGVNIAGSATAAEACPISDIAKLCLMQTSLDEMEARVNQRGWTWAGRPELKSTGGAAVVTTADGNQFRVSYKRYSDMISIQCEYFTISEMFDRGKNTISDCSNAVEEVQNILPEGTKSTNKYDENLNGKNFHFERGNTRFDADVVIQRPENWTDSVPLPVIIQTHMIHLLDVH